MCLDMIDRQTAEQLADDFINSPRWNRTGDRFVILSGRTIEKEYGWVFFYDSEDHLRNGDKRPPLVGAAPVLVTKADGSVQPLGTAFPIEIILAEYEAMRSLPPRRPQASVVYLLNQHDVLDMHTSLDMQTTLCGKPVLMSLEEAPTVQDRGGVAHTCADCKLRAKELGLICPKCGYGLLSATSPDWCMMCRLKRRCGMP